MYQTPKAANIQIKQKKLCSFKSKDNLQFKINPELCKQWPISMDLVLKHTATKLNKIQLTLFNKMTRENGDVIFKTQQ